MKYLSVFFLLFFPCHVGFSPLEASQEREIEACSVCLEEAKNKLYCLPKKEGNCGHVFHNRCIKAWFDQQRKEGNNPSCPLCKVPVEIKQSLFTRFLGLLLRQNGFCRRKLPARRPRIEQPWIPIADTSGF